MSDFAILHTKMWRDPAFVDLTPDARLLFLWAWTNPEAAISGLYAVSAKRMAQALGAMPGDPASAWAAKVDAALKELAAKPLVLWDDDAEVLWVVTRAHHSNRSPKAAAVMTKELARCPPSPLKEAFIERYPALAKGGRR